MYYFKIQNHRFGEFGHQIRATKSTHKFVRSQHFLHEKTWSCGIAVHEWILPVKMRPPQVVTTQTKYAILPNVWSGHDNSLTIGGSKVSKHTDSNNRAVVRLHNFGLQPEHGLKLLP